MRTLLSKNWNVMRVLRLAIGAWCIIAAFQTKETILGVMGGLLLLMAVMNIGCCGVSKSSTQMTPGKNLSQKPEEISYEEITQK